MKAIKTNTYKTHVNTDEDVRFSDQSKSAIKSVF